MRRRRNPSVGIWWLHARWVIIFSRPVLSVRPEAGYADYPHGHAALWSFVQRRYPELRGREYWSLPRGRVLRSVAEDHFLMLLPTAMASNHRVVSRLKRLFGLPPAGVLALTDEHYDAPSDADDD
jgi:hypothetical protein